MNPFSLAWQLHTSMPGWGARRKILYGVCQIPGMSRTPLVREYTYLTQPRLKAIERHILSIRRDGIPGGLAECGVASGGSAGLMGMYLDSMPERQLYLFDTFEGLPAPTLADPDFEEAREWTGKCRGTLSDVRALLEGLHVPLDRVKFIQGLFQDTLPVWNKQPLALLHLDGDWYDSIHVCLAELWDCVVPGGIVQIDDYGRWEGCRRAVDEFLEGHLSECEVRPIQDGALMLRRNRR